MPEERVTTGSEPRRFLLAAEKGTSRWGVVPHADEAKEMYDEGYNVILVQEVVEPGHDEQTEDLPKPAQSDSQTGAKAASQAGSVPAQIEVDPRTVAAVVEFVKGMRGNAELTPDLVAYAIRREFEERFKPSAPGKETP